MSKLLDYKEAVVLAIDGVALQMRYGDSEFPWEDMIAAEFHPTHEYRVKPEPVSNTQHVHAELIKRWADDTSLVILKYSTIKEKWIKLTMGTLWNDNDKYFLVCEKHVEVALHWLNGSKVEFKYSGDWRKTVHPSFADCQDYRKAPSAETVERITQLKHILNVQCQSIVDLNKSNDEITKELNDLA